MIKRWNVIPKYLNKNSNIIGAEIGVWDGKNAVELLKNNKNLFLYLVDRWEYPNNKDSYFYSKDSKVINTTQKDFDDAYKKALSSLKNYKERYKIIKKDSTSAFKLFNDESLDFIFIDGDHSYEGVLNDLNSWYPKVKKGGIISGHDYEGAKEHFGVKKAVDEFFGKENIIKDEDHTWFFKKGIINDR